MAKIEEKLAEFWGMGAEGLLRECLEKHKPSCEQLEWNAKRSTLDIYKDKWNKYLTATFLGRDLEKQKKIALKEDKKKLSELKGELKKIKRKAKKKGVPIV